MCNDSRCERSSVKPHVVLNLPATREAIAKAFGPKVEELFVPNPSVTQYGVAMCFPDVKTIVSGELRRALHKAEGVSGPILIVARDLTVEARRIAAEAGRDLITRHEFGWTDEIYNEIR